MRFKVVVVRYLVRYKGGIQGGVKTPQHPVIEILPEKQVRCLRKTIKSQQKKVFTFNLVN